MIGFDNDTWDRKFEISDLSKNYQEDSYEGEIIKIARSHENNWL